MADTDKLLNLLQEFPAAFQDPEQVKAQGISQQPVSLVAEKTEQLLSLIPKFPEAFADPEAPSPSSASAQSESDSQPDSTTAATVSPTLVTDATTTLEMAVAELPSGYAQALHRRLTTFTWGTIECHLTYRETGLERFWITVGKSGTEVQSLCEAIARLVNLLLARSVPIQEIVKELRGIRGGNSEGLGPNKILGLADLVGKVLQEAPVEIVPGPGGFNSPIPAAVPVDLTPTPEPEAVVPVQQAIPKSEPQDLFNFSGDDYAADLCPECGSQLQQVNGCSGGACTVCGYSSCS